MQKFKLIELELEYTDRYDFQRRCIDELTKITTCGKIELRLQGRQLKFLDDAIKSAEALAKQDSTVDIRYALDRCLDKKIYYRGEFRYKRKEVLSSINSLVNQIEMLDNELFSIWEKIKLRKQANMLI